jgi:hypothetical protein
MDVAQGRHYTNGYCRPPFELIAYMGVKRIGAMARRLRLFNSAAHCYFFASFVRFAPRCRLLSQLSNSFCI